MNKRAEMIERMKRLNEAVEKARAYLANKDHSDWHGFRPLFGDSRDRPPHPDWVANVFLPRRLAAIDRCEKVLDVLERQEKERRISRKRNRSK